MVTGVMTDAMMPATNDEAPAAVRTLKPLTCIPNTAVGPVEIVEDGGTVEVTTPQGPLGVVDW